MYVYVSTKEATQNTIKYPSDMHQIRRDSRQRIETLKGARAGGRTERESKIASTTLAEYRPTLAVPTVQDAEYHPLARTTNLSKLGSLEN